MDSNDKTERAAGSDKPPRRATRGARPAADPAAASGGAAARFLRAARQCQIHDLEQLSILGELVRDLSELIHALQKERGASSIFLGSNGVQYSDRMIERVDESRKLESAVRQRIEHVDETLDRMSSGARFYIRLALALRAMETLPMLRQQIASLAMAPQDSVHAFTVIIGRLLAVGFEAGDIAADPVICRALIALVNLAQAKEYAGQERATVGACLSSGHFEASDRRRMQQLINAQDQSFRIFAEFSDTAQNNAFKEVSVTHDAQEMERLRQVISQNAPDEPLEVAADTWYRHTTARIDALHAIEDALSRQLTTLCNLKLDEVRTSDEGATARRADEILAIGPVGILLSESDLSQDIPILEPGGVYTLENPGPKPMRSILNVIQAQSRRIDDVCAQLESARAALGERKVIDRAKGLLMSSRKLSEQAAYALMRETAMRQNKRIVDIAESIVSMADILKA